MKRKEPVLNGILLVDKPAGWTSHDVVARCRRLLGERRIGHTGTLDPAATGLLVLCVGHATRLVEEMTAHTKRYSGEIRLGVATDSDDATGKVIDERPVPEFGDEVLRELEMQFSGEIEQTPPAFSAIQSGGQRAYAAARAGTPLKLAPRLVAVHELRLWPTGPSTLALSVHCGPGTYIRSLARDIGVTLGCGGHLSSLRRDSVGSFGVADGWQLAEIEALAGRGMAGGVLLPIDEGLTAMSAAILSGDHVEDVLHGIRVQLQVPDVGAGRTPVRVYSDEGALVAVGALEPDGVLRPKKVLARPD